MKGVGAVMTMSPNYVAAVYTRDGLKEKGTGTGKAYRFTVCMSCILKIESFIKGEDFMEPGQSKLTT